jgi:hypothetical protein
MEINAKNDDLAVFINILPSSNNYRLVIWERQAILITEESHWMKARMF